jgi:hypothetical protein
VHVKRLDFEQESDFLMCNILIYIPLEVSLLAQRVPERKMHWSGKDIEKNRVP